MEMTYCPPGRRFRVPTSAIIVALALTAFIFSSAAFNVLDGRDAGYIPVDKTCRAGAATIDAWLLTPHFWASFGQMDYQKIQRLENGVWVDMPPLFEVPEGGLHHSSTGDTVRLGSRYTFAFYEYTGPEGLSPGSYRIAVWLSTDLLRSKGFQAWCSFTIE